MLMVEGEIISVLHLKIVELRKRNKLTQSELANKIGVTRSALSQYEIGTRNPDYEILQKMSIFFEVSTDYLLGNNDNLKQIQLPYGAIPYEPDKMVRLPILGTIRAGEPILMQENIEGYESVEPELLRGRRGFVLRVKGDSMSGDRIYDGDRVVVVIEDDVSPTDIAVVAINGNEATLKRVKCQGGICILISSNPEYEPMMYKVEKVHIIGKVIEVRHTIS